MFHLDTPSSPPIILTRGAVGPDLPARADTAHSSQALTETANPDTATPEAFEISKRNLNHVRPIDGQILSTSLPAEPDSDVISAASFEGSDGDSEYVELAKNSPTRSATTPDLKRHMSKLEMMQEFSEGEITEIFQPTVIFSHTDEIEIQELADVETNLPQNFQDNGAMSSVGTQPLSSHLPLGDTLVAPSKPIPYPHVEAGDAALQASAGDLLDVRLLGVDNMIFSVYQDWVHQNKGEHLDGVITEDGKCKARWKN